MISNTSNARISRLLAVLVCASLVLSSFAAAPAPAVFAQVEPPAPLSIDESRVNFRQIVVKFNPAAEIAIQDGAFVSASGLDLTPVQQVLLGQNVRPLFTNAAPVMEQVQVSALGSGYVPALDQYYGIELGAEATAADAQAVLDSLLASPAVETAYMEPVYLPASRLMASDDFSSMQGYLLPAADNGIDANYAWTISGGRGLDVQVIDVEAGWQIDHEDLPITSSSLIESGNSSDPNFVAHGTAVLGVIGARNEAVPSGMIGIASQASLRMVSNITFWTPDAILKAAAYSRPGDIIVIPIQMLGPLSGLSAPIGCDVTAFESIPVEYTQANFDAIYAATQMGIIVVEAAGTGAMNLDANRYGGLFNRGNRDSGAIMVGSGDSVTRSPTCDANYGKRIDVQGWGNNVATTGYGDLNQGDGPHQYYTSSFSGSSAAAAIVAGASASLQGVAKRRGYLLTPDQMRSILRSTGQQQGDPLNQPIGPLPNLRRAIDEKVNDGVKLHLPADNSTVFTLRPTLVWLPYLAATQYEVQLATDALFQSVVFSSITTATEFTVPGNLNNNRDYYWRVRPFVNSLWPDWQTYHFTFLTSAANAPSIALLKPDNNAVITGDQDFSPTFTWKPSFTPAASLTFGYHVQWSTNFNFEGASEAEVPVTPTFTPPALETNRRYYWRVRSYIGDAPDRYYGAWSARRVLYTSLDADDAEPLDILIDGNEETLRPTFDWNDVDNALGYEIQVSTINTFKTSLFTATIAKPANAITPSEFVPAGLLPRSKTLFWRVRVRGAFAMSAWTNSVPFDTLNPPNVPGLVSPANGFVASTWEDGVLLKWGIPGNAPDGYHVQVSTTAKFDNIVIDDTTADPDDPTYLVPGLEPENVYFWRVRAYGDGFSTWSAVRKFYTTPPAPTGLTIEASDTLRPTFNWDPSFIARSYQIQVARNNDAEPDLNKIFVGTRIVASMTTLISPPTVLAATLPRSRDLIWRVRAGGLYGYGAWAYGDVFTSANPPNTPVQITPGSGANLTAFNPLLGWSASVKIKNNPDADAVAYQVQVADSTSFSATGFLYDIEVPGTSHRLPADTLPQAGTFYWRVRAVNDLGEFSIWSPVWSFTTPGILSGVITDAITGDPLAGVLVEVSGRALSSITNLDGEYEFRGLPAGSHQLVTSYSGYMRQSVPFGINSGANRVRNIALASIPEDGVIRIVLTWSGAVADLDAHLWLPANVMKYHLWKDNPGGDASNATLEREDSDGYGPEIITLDSTFNGPYQFAVFTNGTAEQFAGSGAMVQVYQGSKRLASYNIPTTGVGRWWKVFSLDGGTLKVTGQNVITDINPRPYAD